MVVIRNLLPSTLLMILAVCKYINVFCSFFILNVFFYDMLIKRKCPFFKKCKCPKKLKCKCSFKNRNFPTKSAKVPHRTRLNSQKTNFFYHLVYLQLVEACNVVTRTNINVFIFFTFFFILTLFLKIY